MRQDLDNISLPQENEPLNNNPNIESSKDSLVFFSDSLFRNLDSKLKVISKNTFQGYEKNYRPTCSLDSNGFMKDKGLVLGNYCKDICESYLLDKKERIKLILPSDYDQGIIGLDLSPSCNQFIVYSSYDRPNYKDYYEYRAEVFGFTISQGQGLQTIKPAFKFYTKDWSIEEVIWISDSEIALKTYQENRTTTNQNNLNYKYFKTSTIN